jgi:hypothetical protein
MLRDLRILKSGKAEAISNTTVPYVACYHDGPARIMLSLLPHYTRLAGLDASNQT